MASEIISKKIYNGLYDIIHNPNARGRAPRYLIDGKDKPKGVTTILGQTLSKDLTDWAVQACCDYLREKLPVITEEDLVEGGNAYKRLRDAGAGTGSEAHAMVEDYLKGREPATTQHSDEAINAYQAFVEWFEEVQPTVINVEEVIYSPTLSYAGTYDCLLGIGDRVYLCDLKTTNVSRKAPSGIYAENFIQLGAYALAHEEQRQYELENGGTKLLQIDDLMVISAKKNGALDIVTASDLDLSVSDCGEKFKEVVLLNQFMTSVTSKLGGK